MFFKSVFSHHTVSCTNILDLQYLFHSRQCCCYSVTKSCLILCDPMDCNMPGLPVPHHLLEFAQVRVRWIGDAIQSSHPLLPSSTFAFNLSQHQVAKVLKLQPTPLSWLFASGGQSISFSFSINPSNDYSGLISFRADWFDLLALQGTLKSLFQHHSSKASILWCSGFMVQLSHPYLTTGKTIALTIRTFVGEVMSLLLIQCLGLSRLSCLTFH